MAKPLPPALVDVPSPAETAQIVKLDDQSPPARPASPAINLVWNSSRPVPTNPPRMGQPSEREWQILRCVSRGGSNKMIARELGISETTVKVHIKSLLRKLGVSNRTQAAIWAIGHDQDVSGPATAKRVQGAVPE